MKNLKVLTLIIVVSFLTIACGSSGGGGGGSSTPTTTNGFSNASLNGTYRVVEFFGGTGWTSSSFVSSTFDGAGNFTGTGTSSETNQGANVPVSRSGTYNVNADGTLTITGPDGTINGALNDSGDILVVSNIDEADEHGIFIAIKAGL